MLLPRHQATMIQSSSSTGFGRCYATSRCRYRLMHPGFPTRLSATKTHSSSPSSGARGTTFRLGCGYTPSSFTAVAAYTAHTKKISALVPDSMRNLMTACRKNLLHGLDIANPFPPDLSGYMHGFNYCVIYDLLWQIPFRWIFEVTCIDLAINQHDVQPGSLIVPLVQTIEKVPLL